MLGPIEIVLVKNIDELGYTINNNSGETELLYVLVGDAVQPIVFSRYLERIYQAGFGNGTTFNIQSTYWEQV